MIAIHGLRSILRKRAFLFLMILSWIPVVVRGVQIWAAANVPGMSQIGMLAVTPQMFRDFLNQQEPLVFFITVYVGSGLIADDIRATLESVRPYADALACAAGLERIAETLRAGNDSRWMRDAYARSESLPDLVYRQAERWRGRRPR